MSAFTKVFLCVALLLGSFNTFAQTRSVKNYKVPFEKVYIHTDREIYLAGDDIWFKAYLLNGQTNQPGTTSNNLYVELISPRAEIVKRNIIRIEYSVGNGDFKLADSIPTGRYRLRAYTNWMRNFGDNFVFEKNIDIINPAAQKHGDLNTKATVIKAGTTVRFFPEGGSLIEGVASLIAVKAEDYTGKGISVTGNILNTIGDTLSTFKTDTLGMGLLSLLPLAGQSYHAVTNYNNKHINVDIPQALKLGLNFNILKSDTLINVIINTNAFTLSSLANKYFTIIGKHTGILCLRKPVSLTGNQTLLRIPKSFFPEGLTNLTLYDEQNKPYTERLIYVEHPESRTQLNIKTDKTVYHARDKITVTVKLSDSTSKANLSMTVIDENVLPVSQESITTYLMLTSELKGNIEKPNRYFDTTNVNRARQLDLLLLTQGWRDFVWKRVADSAIRLNYIAENGFNITGLVRKKLSKKPISNMYITLTAFKAQGQKVYSAKTDSLGHYIFNNLLLFGPQQVSLTARNASGNRAGWLLLDSLTKDPLPVINPPSFALDTNITSVKSLIQRENDIKKAAGIKMLKEVKITDRKPVLLGKVTAFPFGYLEQHFTITKKDEYYEALDNWMAHNIKGTIINDKPGVMFVGQGGPAYLKGLMYPHFVVNGVDMIPENGVYVEYPKRVGFVQREMSDDDARMEVTMAEQYFNLTMDKVNKVDFKHLVGHDPDQGKTIDVFVLYLDIKPNAFENKDFGLQQVDIPGYYEARTFYKPLYDIPADKNKPDMRTTIHWEPQIIIHKKQDAVMSFYNADPKSKVRIIVQGITDKGVPVFSTLSYQVN